MPVSLEDSLLEFFKRTTVSAAIIKTFAQAEHPLKFGELTEGLESRLSGLLPDYALEGAARSALKLLKASGWVVKDDAEFSLTELGKELVRRIED